MGGRGQTIRRENGEAGESEFKVGDCVWVQGLKGKPEYNGKKGKIVVSMNQNGRWGVRLDQNNKGLMLKPANLKKKGVRMVPSELWQKKKGGKKFYPTKEWQAIPEGMSVPPGCDYRVDVKTGKTMVKLSVGQASRQTSTMAKKTENDLKAAISWGDEKKVKDILNSGGKPSEEFLSELLFQAVQTGNSVIVSSILGKGAKASSRNEANFTPLHMAIREGHEEVAEIIIKQFPSRARFNEATVRHGKSVFEFGRQCDMGSMTKRLEKFVGHNLK